MPGADLIQAKAEKKNVFLTRIVIGFESYLKYKHYLHLKNGSLLCYDTAPYIINLKDYQKGSGKKNIKKKNRHNRSGMGRLMGAILTMHVWMAWDSYGVT